MLCVGEGSLKRFFRQGGDDSHMHGPLLSEVKARQSTGSNFTAQVIKPLLLCRHAVSHFKPVMMSLGAGLTPVVIRLPAVYSPTTLRSKISLCSVEEMLLVVKVGLHSV